MDDLTQRIVEAGARAIETQMALDDNSPEDIARACLSAAHALAEQEGAVRKECLRTALEAVAREAQACPPGTAEVTLAVVGAIARAALAPQEEPDHG